MGQYARDSHILCLILQLTGAVDLHSVLRALAKQGLKFTIVNHGRDGVQRFRNTIMQ
jgi:hypothetical protein